MSVALLSPSESANVAIASASPAPALAVGTENWLIPPTADGDPKAHPFHGKTLANCIVGDALEVLPALTEAVKAAKG